MGVTLDADEYLEELQHVHRQDAELVGEGGVMDEGDELLDAVVLDFVPEPQVVVEGVVVLHVVAGFEVGREHVLRDGAVFQGVCEGDKFC